MAGVTYDVLWNERREAIAGLRNLNFGYTLERDNVAELFRVFGVNLYDTPMVMTFENVRDRLIHLLGGDQPSGIDVLRVMDANGTSQDNNGTCPNDVPTASITDELREWASTEVPYKYGRQLHAIADRIDEQFDRICQQQEDVLQETIDEMVVDQGSWKTTADMWKAKADKMERECDELRDEDVEIKRQYAKLCIERADLLDLLRDARDEYKLLDKMSAETSANFHAMRDRVWGLEAERDELQAKLDKANGENKGLRLSIDEQKEAISQRKKTIGKLTRDNEKVWKTVHELQAKLNECERTHVELPRDANGEVFHVGCTVRMVERHPDVLLTVHSMTMCDDGEWLLMARDDEEEYFFNQSASEFEVCDRPQDTAESIVRDLSMGVITESEAIERIGKLNG